MKKFLRSPASNRHVPAELANQNLFRIPKQPSKNQKVERTQSSPSIFGSLLAALPNIRLNDKKRGLRVLRLHRVFSAAKPFQPELCLWRLKNFELCTPRSHAPLLRTFHDHPPSTNFASAPSKAPKLGRPIDLQSIARSR